MGEKNTWEEANVKDLEAETKVKEARVELLKAQARKVNAEAMEIEKANEETRATGKYGPE